MAKEKKQDCGWQFPKALEIVKCKEGNKEFMKERPARRPFGNTVLICEYPLDGDAMQEPNARMITWRLAKRAETYTSKAKALKAFADGKTKPISGKEAGGGE